MRKKPIQKINQAFSIPLDVSNELHMYVKQCEMSHFVSEAIRKELEAKKNQLRSEYEMARADKRQLETMKDWEITIGDGLDKW